MSDRIGLFEEIMKATPNRECEHDGISMDPDTHVFTMHCSKCGMYMICDVKAARVFGWCE